MRWSWRAFNMALTLVAFDAARFILSRSFRGARLWMARRRPCGRRRLRRWSGGAEAFRLQPWTMPVRAAKKSERGLSLQAKLPAMAPAPAYPFTSCYFGGNAGGVWGKASHTFDNGAGRIKDCSCKPSSWIAGGQWAASISGPLVPADGRAH